MSGKNDSIFSSESGFIQINGCELYYERTGSGHPLILLHGGLVHSGLWDVQFRFLSRYFHVIRYDYRGYGRSRIVPGPFSHLEDLEGIFQLLHIEKAHLLGLSLGGALAVDFTLQHPEKVSALVLASSGLTGYDPPPEVLEELKRAGQMILAGNQEQGVELLLRLWTDGPQRKPNEVNPAVREKIKRMIEENLAQERLDARPKNTPSALEKLDQIRAPTLIIVGEKDVQYILAIGELLAQKIPRALKIIFPESAHHLNLEHPEEFNRHVRAFLQSYSAAHL